ncbi:hypothetical protein KBB76_01155 [Candidatus Saccharibacteria bacterium]|jgi:hypothetical protein|nr:hypothetical protein [Candidatus Saccharibacteria bacterium]HOR23152.1 hypothetical protein [Candidatus Saccharibacteria bacterium]HPW48328.1 hypothetical protein [Candidatus Saccharibacteria bacterium]
MEPTSKEPLPTLPRPERGGPRVDELEMISAPEETFEKGSLPSESLRQASDAVSQAYVASDSSVLASDLNAAKTSTDGTSQTNPAIADDVDVIEKEWVEKAKQIVATTHDDPHAQSGKINILKHDYLKKRYGKEIKLPKEQG